MAHDMEGAVRDEEFAFLREAAVYCTNGMLNSTERKYDGLAWRVKKRHSSYKIAWYE